MILEIIDGAWRIFVGFGVIYYIWYVIDESVRLTYEQGKRDGKGNNE